VKEAAGAKEGAGGEGSGATRGAKRPQKKGKGKRGD
jgi:hypothetical protein